MTCSVVNSSLSEIIQVGGSNDIVATSENILVLTSTLFDSRTFGTESTKLAAVIELIELSFESEAPPNLKQVDSLPTDEDEVNDDCGTLSIFLLKPNLTDVTSTLVSLDGAALSKLNIGPVLVDSVEGTK